MPRAGLNTDVVVTAAGDLADRRGLDALSLTVLAEHLGVRVPSLYKHIEGMTDLRRRLALTGFEGLNSALRTAVGRRQGSEALHTLARGYRDYARAHPGCYAAALQAPTPGDTAAAAAAAAADLVFDVIADYDLTGQDAIHTVRMLRATLHGFIALEAAGGFGLPTDIDLSFDHAIDIIDVALLHQTRARADSRERK